jgi:hypothetical protein
LVKRVPNPGKLENRARSHHVFTAAKHTTDIVHVGRSLRRIEHDHSAQVELLDDVGRELVI